MNHHMFCRGLMLLMSVAISRFACGATSISETLNVDTSWRAIGPVGDLTGQGINNVGLAWEAGHVGWNNAVNYDDTASAGWTNAIQVVHPSPPLIRYWVDGTDTVGSSPAYFRRVFNIPGMPIVGTLDFVVDDDAQIYVNGQLVFNDADSLATFVDDINVLPHLVQGLNLIAVKAQDQQGAQSINGQLDITYQVPEPSTLTVTALTFISGIALMLRPRRGIHRLNQSAATYLRKSWRKR